MLPDVVKEIAAKLASPFKPDEVQWKAQATNKEKTRALAVPYVDARTVMERLDEVLGLDGWTDTYRDTGTSVICTLACRFRCGESEVWVEKSDAGGQADVDEGDKLKSAVSDALKRVAVKFGIGRYLYDVPKVWCGYDAKTKQLVDPPKSPYVKAPEPLPAPVAVVPGDWLKGQLKGKKTVAEALCRLAGVDKLGQAQLAWFPWLRDLVKAGANPDDVKRDYLNSVSLAELPEETVAAAYTKWQADRKGTRT